MTRFWIGVIWMSWGTHVEIYWCHLRWGQSRLRNEREKWMCPLDSNKGSRPLPFRSLFWKVSSFNRFLLRLSPGWSKGINTHTPFIWKRDFHRRWHCTLKETRGRKYWICLTRVDDLLINSIQWYPNDNCRKRENP